MDILSGSTAAWFGVAIFAVLTVGLPLLVTLLIVRWVFTLKPLSFMGGGKRAHQIQTSGRPATATVLWLSEVQSTSDDRLYLDFTLRIDDPTRPPYDVNITTTVEHDQLPRFQPGEMFAVRVDNDDPKAVVIAPDDPMPVLGDTTAHSLPGSPPTVVAEHWSQTDLIKLERHGKQGLARVLAAAPTGRFEGTSPIVHIDYEILLPGENPYSVSKEVGMPPDATPQIKSKIGRTFPVTVHPEDPHKVKVNLTF